MRKLSKLEAEAIKLLSDEVEAYFAGKSIYELGPGYYPNWEIARHYICNSDRSIDGCFVLEQYQVGEERMLSLSLSFDRPSRDWTLSTILNSAQSLRDIKQINISKEYHGMGNGRYLIAERIGNRWIITASEDD